MDDRMPHYLRFARTLALATTLALPACSDGGDASASATDDLGDEAGSTTSATTSAGTGADATPRTAHLPTMIAPHEQGAGGGGGASPGKLSGPLPPPEMPASMA